MDLPFELHVAVRYLLAKRKQAFISVISLISTLGVTVGVMALVIALALMNGLQGEIRDRIVGANPHIYVWKTTGIDDYHAEAARLKKVPHVLGAAPAILGKALINSSRLDDFVNLTGIDPALEEEVTDLRSAMQTGQLEGLDNDPEDGALGGILLGKDLARGLGVSVGDSVQVVTPHGTLSPMGMVPVPRRLRVAGTFSLGLYEFDNTTGFVSLDVAKRLFGKDIDLIQLRVDDIWRASAVAHSITESLGDKYFTQDWSEMNRSLFSALWLEKIAISLTIGLIMMVAALNIIASLILLVMEKNRDIAILKTMGASARSVTAIFMMQGLIIGVVGTTVGGAAGWALSYVLDRYKLISVPMDVYQVSHVPFKVQPGDFALVIVAAILVCFVATIYPSRQAAKLDPAQALRYE
jgi:lipoprotein-releasing system permease protein